MRNTVLPYAAAIALFIGFGSFFWLSSGSLQAKSDDSVIFLSWVVSFVSMGYLVFRGLGYALAAGVPRDTAYARATAIASSGACLAFVRTDGWLGDVRLSGPLLSVSVHPGGIVVKPLFFPPCTVFASEIQGVDTDRIWGREYLVVRHQGTGCPTPLAIPVGGQSAMAAVGRAIAGALPESAPAEEKPTRRRWLAAGFSMSVRGTGYLDAYPRGVVVLLGLAGLALAAFFVVDGITSLIPETGFFGLIWTGLAALFLLSGLRELVRYLSRW